MYFIDSYYTKKDISVDKFMVLHSKENPLRRYKMTFSESKWNKRFNYFGLNLEKRILQCSDFFS